MVADAAKTSSDATDLRLVELAPPLARRDVAFVEECLSELFPDLAGRGDALERYLESTLRSPDVSLLVLEAAAERVGLVTLVRVPMPRYLGFAYEIEELVVLEGFRRRGFARRALGLVEARCREDGSARKVVIRTTVPEARRAYETVWTKTEMTSYQTMLNLLERASPEDSRHG